MRHSCAVAQVGNQETPLGVGPSFPPCLCQGLLLIAEEYFRASLLMSFLGYPCLHLPSSVMHYCVWLHVNLEDPSSRPHGWTVTALHTEPSPQLKTILWFQRNYSCEGQCKHGLNGLIITHILSFFFFVPSFCIFSIMFLNYPLAYKKIVDFLCI